MRPAWSSGRAGSFRVLTNDFGEDARVRFLELNALDRHARSHCAFRDAPIVLAFALVQRHELRCRRMTGPARVNQVLFVKLRDAEL